MPEHVPSKPRAGADPAHAPGKHHQGPPPAATPSHRDAAKGQSHRQPWVATSGKVGRQRRSPHG